MAQELTPEQQALFQQALNQQTAEAQQRALQLQQDNDQLRTQLAALAEQMNSTREAASVAATASEAAPGGLRNKLPKIPEPPTYDGRSRLDQWEPAMAGYLELYGSLHTPFGATVAAQYLRGAMRKVYDLHREDVAKLRATALPSFQALVDLLRAHRPEPDHFRAARERIENLRQQRGQLDRYTSAFLASWQDVRSYMAESDGVWHFTRGLERELQTEVHKVTNITDPLDSVIRVAYRLDEVLSASKRSARLYSNFNTNGGGQRSSDYYKRSGGEYSVSKSREDGPTAMDLGAFTTSRGGGGRSRDNRGQRQGRAGFSGYQAPRPRGGPDGCWICGNSGHFARDCPRNRKGPITRENNSGANWRIGHGRAPNAPKSKND
jgi:hypothetical protein